jgi:4-amino-4-deoxy-L-arabinose transferase-like glycosyltransferase
MRSVVERASRLPLVAVVVLAIAVRLAAGVAFPAADADTYEFGWMGRNIAEGRGYSYFFDDPVGRLTPEESERLGRPFPSAYMPPVYTYLTAGATELGGSDADTVWLLRIANLAGAAGGVLLMRRLARRLVGAGAATLAAIGFAVYPSLIYASTQVSASNIYIPLELGVLLVLLRATESATWRSWALAGASVGALALVRAEAAAAIVLAGLWLVWSARRRQTSAPPARLVAVFLCVAAVIPGAWIARNSIVLGAPVLTVTTTGGHNLWIGNHDGATGSQKDFDIPERIEDEIRSLPAGADFELRADAVYRREAFDSVAGDPLGTVARDVKKAAMLLGADVYDKRNLNPLYLGPYVLIATMGGLGLVHWWQRRPRRDTVRWLVVGYAAFSIAVPVVFFALARYRLPVEVVLLVFSAAWLTGRFGGDHGAKTEAETPGMVPVPG